MKYQCGLIPENTAPPGSTKIGVYDSDGNRVCNIGLGRLTPPSTEPLYSFGLLSDLHLNTTDSGQNSTRFSNALTFFEAQGCSFCCHTGDMTNIGFWMEGTKEYTTEQFNEYKRIRGLHPNLPVYGCCGNHDSYTKAITDNLTELKTYTGHGLHFSMTHGDDLFLFLGQPSATIPMSDDALAWLETMLEANADKRCFVFVHPFVDDSDSGNPFGLYENKVFDWWGTKKATFIELLAGYNVILFHGHSHMCFEAQKEVKYANYSNALGFHSVHIPSIASKRDVTGGVLTGGDGCQGYVVDVYDNNIVLRGYDWLTGGYSVIAQYRIAT